MGGARVGRCAATVAATASAMAACVAAASAGLVAQAAIAQMAQSNAAAGIIAAAYRRGYCSKASFLTPPLIIGCGKWIPAAPGRLAVRAAPRF